jgi:hypothetical protein
MHPDSATPHPSRFGSSLALGLILTLAAPGLTAAVQTPGIEGHWEGAIVVREAEIEADMTVDISRGADNALGGKVSVPIQDVHDRPLESVVEKADVVSLVFRDGAELSIFNGTLSGDGKTIEGDLSEEGHSFKFVLHRQETTAPAAAKVESPALHPLAASLVELKQRFNADAGHVRLLLLLSPGQHGSVMTSRLIRRYLLDRLADERLRVYVVWVATLDGDTEAAARTASLNLTDPRVVQFFSPDLAVSKAFQAPLAFKEPLVREVALVYGADQAWGEGIPAPRLLMHRSRLMPEAQRLNAAKLADALKDLLAPAPAPAKPAKGR